MMPPTPTERAPQMRRGLLALAAVAACLTMVIVGLAATTWVGRPFPGFFVLSNRVIPSVGLPGWAGSTAGTIYQSTILEVNGVPAAASADVYRPVQSQPAGTTFTYMLRRGNVTEHREVPSRTFSWLDYWTIFGSYLVTGFLWLLVALLAGYLLPHRHVGRALFGVGAVGGLFALSGAGIYDPNGPIRLHALAEALFPATFVSLALAFLPAPNVYTRLAHAMSWWVGLSLALAYQLVLHEPGAYPIVHGASEAFMSLAAVSLTGTLVVLSAQATTADPLLRGATLGALLGLGLPATVMLLSGVSGGAIPVNIVTATAFLFPLCLGYGVVGAREVILRARVEAGAAVPPTY